MRNDLYLQCNLKELRCKRGFTQDELAKLCGVSQNTISNIEVGQFLPGACLIYKLLIVLGCKFEELFYLPLF